MFGVCYVKRLLSYPFRFATSLCFHFVGLQERNKMIPKALSLYHTDCDWNQCEYVRVNYSYLFSKNRIFVLVIRTTSHVCYICVSCAYIYIYAVLFSTGNLIKEMLHYLSFCVSEEKENSDGCFYKISVNLIVYFILMILYFLHGSLRSIPLIFHVWLLGSKYNIVSCFFPWKTNAIFFIVARLLGPESITKSIYLADQNFWVSEIRIHHWRCMVFFTWIWVGDMFRVSSKRVFFVDRHSVLSRFPTEGEII